MIMDFLEIFFTVPLETTLARIHTYITASNLELRRSNRLQLHSVALCIRRHTVRVLNHCMVACREDVCSHETRDRNPQRLDSPNRTFHATHFGFYFQQYVHRGSFVAECYLLEEIRKGCVYALGELS